MKKTASVFIPHYGCPNDCVFCNQVKISGKTTNLDYVAIEKDIIRDISTIDEKDTAEIAFFGGSFTAIEGEVQEICLSLANNLRKKLNREIKIKLSTRPDAIDEKIIDRLLKYKVDTVELGVQSLDDEVLFFSNRGHNSEQVFKASQLIKQANISLGLQIMIGLPNDTKEKLYNTIEKVISIKPDIARIYPVLVIKDTQLEHMYRQGIYKAIELDEAIDLSAYMYKKFENSGINVIRIGLQATDNINFDKDVVAGPFHSAFGELVLNKIYRDKIEQILLEENFAQKTVVIKSHKKYISKILGNKKRNYNYFKDKYGISIKIETSQDDIIDIMGRRFSDKSVLQ